MIITYHLLKHFPIKIFVNINLHSNYKKQIAGFDFIILGMQLVLHIIRTTSSKEMRIGFTQSREFAVFTWPEYRNDDLIFWFLGSISFFALPNRLMSFESVPLTRS